MILGISAAMPGELSMLTRERLAVGECRRLGPGVVVALSGVGPERARRAGEELIAQGAVALLSWGVAAGLDPGLAPGSLVLPREIIAADLAVYVVDHEWHERLRHGLIPKIAYHTGALAESEGVVESPAEKCLLRMKTEADAADMESAALARLAHEGGLRFCAVRAIVDPAGMALPRSVLESMDENGMMRLRRLLPKLLRHPGDLAALIRLGRFFGVARQTLARVAELTGPQMMAF